MKKIAVFASGSGTNYEAICDAIDKGILNCEVSVLVCDKPGAYVISRAERHNHKVFVFNPKDYSKKSEYEDLILEEVKDVDLIVLAGYMRIISKRFIDKFKGKILNLHPALLPSFKGAHAIVDAYNFGVKVFGITIHFIDETVDGGVIVEQASFHMEDNEGIDSVEAKIHALEHEYFPKTIEKVLNGGF